VKNFLPQKCAKVAKENSFCAFCAFFAANLKFYEHSLSICRLRQHCSRSDAGVCQVAAISGRW
jgi:hypothetical protein